MGRLRRSQQRAVPLSSLCNVAAYKDAHWMELFRDLSTYSYDAHIFGADSAPNIYRKGWEWTQAIWGLEQLDMIQPHHKAIGVGAGRECVIFWLGDRLRTVVASDLYGGAGWSDTGGREADQAVLEDPQRFCPRPIRSDVIEFKTLDGTDLSIYPADTFDFGWSLSSIEHFGSHERAADAVRELARVIRPGGVVALATEYLLLPEQTHVEYFNRQDLEDFVINATPDLELVEWSLPPADFLIDSIVFPNGIDRVRRHVVLNDGSVQWTSVLLFLRKKSA